MNDKIKAIEERHEVFEPFESDYILIPSERIANQIHTDCATLIEEYHLLEGRFELLNEQYKDWDEDLTFEYDMRVKLEKEMESKS